LIRVERLGGGSARIKVIDAVGLIAIEGLELMVVPKIPQDHFLEIIGRSGGMPRLSTMPGHMETDESFTVLICEWFIRTLEHIVAEGLLRDYRETQDQSTTVRGHLEPLGTTRLFYSGRLAVEARFEKFDQDNALNRVLAEAARTIGQAAPLPDGLRRRAFRALSQMTGVGTMLPSDQAVTVDRSSAYYADGLLLAKEVLTAAGRSFAGRESKAWTFLYRTAIAVEEGIREILAEGCGPLKVRKKSFPLGGVTARANPDLVFGDTVAVGDVKYKTGGTDWDRNDLYQVVAFAAAARVEKGLLVDFGRDVVVPRAGVTFGDIEVVNARWTATASTPFEVARESLVGQVMAALVPALAFGSH
jgi:5-methylcytosine-specific restriction enzyme subunit McrC